MSNQQKQTRSERTQDLPDRDAWDRPLRQDVRRLGTLLGRSLRELGEPQLFETVEAARRAALAGRRGEAQGVRQLREGLEGLESAVALEVARAFSSWFGVVNLAERVHRQRRLGEQASRGEARRGSLREVLERLKAAGLGLAELRELWPRLSVEPVLTAHPTEALRRTFLMKELGMAEALLARREDVEAPGREHVRALDRVRDELHAAWQTDEHLALRPTVADEREQTLFYLSEIVWPALPDLAKTFESELAAVFGDQARELAQELPVRFASWVGGDMDGNPAVDASTIRATLARHAELAIGGWIVELRNLFRTLSQSTSRVGFSGEFEARLAELEAAQPKSVAETPARYADMPYRRFLWLLSDKLRATLGGEDAPAGCAPFAEPEDLDRDLSLVEASLLENRGRHAGVPEVRDLRLRLRAFGFHLATLDVRQDALLHREAIAELIGRGDYPSLDREARTSVLLGALKDSRNASPTATFSAETERSLEVMRAIGEVRARHGSRAVGLFVISMAQGPDDALAVIYLAQRAGLAGPDGVPLDVAPLFETADDLATSPGTVRSLFEEPSYREHLRSRGDLQWIMLGYSDSNKTAGIVPSRVALQRAQSRLLAIAREFGVELAFFHGRGGSTSRGGGKPRDAVLGAASGTLGGRLRVTEQGEIIRAKYGSRGIALRTLELLVGATLERTALDALGQGHDDGEEPLLGELAANSRSAYEQLVQHTPAFFDYFRLATPIDAIERMALGSRPSRRREQRGVTDLRAIPWVFSWTQSRLVLPGWYGSGTALEAARNTHGIAELRRLRGSSPTFAGLLRDLEMVLAKADLGVAERYSELAGELAHELFPHFRESFERTAALVCEVSEIDQLLQGDPRLARAIELRNPYIDPMSTLQIDLLARWRAADRDDPELERALFSTVHGIARGLMNTG